MSGSFNPWQQLGEYAGAALWTFGNGVIVYVAARVASNRRIHGLRKTYRQLHLELKDDIDVNVILDRGWRDTGALRCFLSRLHNGGDLAVRRKTRTHERTAPGVRYQSPELQAVPISRVPEEMELVVDDGVTWKPVAELPESMFKQLCCDGGSADGAIARVAVKVGKEVVGFVGLDFRKTDKPKDIDRILRDCARDVSRILSRYH